MFGYIGKLTAQDGQGSALAALLLAGTRDMAGCPSYVIAPDLADPDTLWITEVWESEEAHAASLTLPQVRAAIEKARPLIAGMEAVAKTAPIAASVAR